MDDRARPLSRSRTAGFAAALAALAVLEVAWLGWFLVEPLPNARPIGSPPLRRWMFLARAFPHVVPGVHFHESYLGLAWEELGHPEHLPQRLPIVGAAAMIAGAALGLGLGVLRAAGLDRVLTLGERIPLAYGLGTTGLGLATLLVGRAGGLAPWPFRIGLGLLAAGGVAQVVGERFRFRETRGSGPETPVPRKKRVSSDRVAAGSEDGSGMPVVLGWAALVLAVGPFLLMMTLGAMLPTIDFDAIEYHLQGPKEYFQAGRIAFLPHNVYTSMPFSVEMLHLLGMEALDDWWSGALAGQLLVSGFAPAAAAMIALTAGRWGSPRAARIGAIVYLTTPWVYRLGVLPYVEGPLCYYHAALVWASARAWSEAEPAIRARLWGVVGLLAGGAMACKYPALVSAVVPFGVLALVDSIRGRSWRAAAAFGLGWLVVMAPWLGKNVLDTGNPVYPLAYRVFGGRGWDPPREAKWSNAHGPKPVTLGLLGQSIVDVAGRSDWQSSLYVALAPLALVRRGSRRLAWVLAAYAAYLFATWWLLTHRLDRFWLPLLPPLAVLAGLGADWVRNRAWSVLLGVLLALTIVTNMAYASTALTGLNDWTDDLLVLRTHVPEMLNAPLARLDAELPPGAKVLLVGQAAVFHLRHPIVYNTVFDHETIEVLTRGRTPAEIRRVLAERGVTHVYVDWFEIDRYRSPGNYGFTPYVTPELFAGLVASRVLEGPESLGARQELYRVRKPGE